MPLVTGSSVGLSIATTVLHDAQIRALTPPGTPILAGVAGKVIVPVSATWQLDDAAGAYVADSGFLQIATDPDFEDWLKSSDIAFFLANAGVYFGYMGLFTTFGQGDLLNVWEGEGLLVYKNGGTNPTGGNAANTLTIRVAYYLVNVA